MNRESVVLDIDGKEYEIPPSSEMRVNTIHITTPAQVPESDERKAALKDALMERNSMLQAAVKEEIMKFNPLEHKAEDFDYLPVGAKLRQITVAEMSALFGYNSAQQAVLDSLIKQKITEPYNAVARNESTPLQIEQASAFHSGYISGQIERCFEDFSQGTVQELMQKRLQVRALVDTALEQLQNGVEASQVHDQLLSDLGKIFSSPEGLAKVKALLDSGWFLSPLNVKDELLIDVNTAGMLATEAVVNFTNQLFFDMSREQVLEYLEELIHLPDAQLQERALLQDPEIKNASLDAQILQFAVRAANYAWIFSKIPQAFTELNRAAVTENTQQKLAQWQEQTKNKGKGAGRYTLSNDGNKYFTTFDNMSDQKGWPAVLLDIDQIRTGVMLLRKKTVATE